VQGAEPPQERPVLLAVALDGAGWHPAAWREPSAPAASLFDAGPWIDLARTAERGAIDFLTFEDGLALQSTDRTTADGRLDHVRGRLDAELLAARVAPATTHIGLVPTVTTTHTEPFHVSTRIASLDFVSRGRAGWRVQVMTQHDELGHFGRRDEDGPLLLDEAGDAVEVVRRLWDSWEDDAEIRDRATGRFIDRDRLHSIDFEGAFFSVRGPSITPRPPQGQPVVAMLAHVPPVYELAARAADVVFVTPRDADEVTTVIGEVRASEVRVDRTGPPLRILADLLVILDDDPDAARRTKARLDDLDGRELKSDALVVATGAGELVDLLVEWRGRGVDGFRLRPGRLPADLDCIVNDVVPEMRRRGLVPDGYTTSTLRARVGLERPRNRYEAVRTGAGGA
jgi:alkanesulfonate monooxygenase SsuD/methylene tetrahydromethanopterin reductase-like flavin-dependent oxidoreductase (luciferase family)